MNSIVFSTGNSQKFLTAKHVCDKFDIAITQKAADILEIQHENPETVAIDKAAKAFAIVGRPVVITDDSWSFPGLKGFPGAYMHSMNEWFTPQDFLNLTLPLTDRRADLTQYLVYTDGSEHKVFSKTSHGFLLKEVKGASTYPSHTIITMDGDHGRSIAEAYDKATDKSSRHSARIWHDFAEWLTKNN